MVPIITPSIKSPPLIDIIDKKVEYHQGSKIKNQRTCMIRCIAASTRRRIPVIY